MNHIYHDIIGKLAQDWQGSLPASKIYAILYNSMVICVDGNIRIGQQVVGRVGK